jgi:hypothetical protein
MVSEMLAPLFFLVFSVYVKVFLLLMIFALPPLTLLFIFLKVSQGGGVAGTSGD